MTRKKGSTSISLTHGKRFLEGSASTLEKIRLKSPVVTTSQKRYPYRKRYR
jgi:hypothetical protein